jgi:hypothetical protein
LQLVACAQVGIWHDAEVFGTAAITQQLRGLRKHHFLESTAADRFRLDVGGSLLRAALSKAAGRGEPLAGDPRGIVGGKENRDSGDVVRLPDATERRASDHLLFEFAAHDAGLVSAFGLDAPRSNSVDPNFSRPHAASAACLTQALCNSRADPL